MPRSESPASPRPAVRHHSQADDGLDHRPIGEEASFLEHRAALDATLFAAGGPKEFVFELEAGRLRRQA